MVMLLAFKYMQKLLIHDHLPFHVVLSSSSLVFFFRYSSSHKLTIIATFLPCTILSAHEEIFDTVDTVLEGVYLLFQVISVSSL